MMEGANEVYCGRCEHKVSKVRRTSLVSLPRVLYLDLVRFEWHGTGRVKSKQKVTVPLTYDFRHHYRGKTHTHALLYFHLKHLPDSYSVALLLDTPVRGGRQCRQINCLS